MSSLTIFCNPTPSKWRELTQRNIPQDDEITQNVTQIIEEVRTGGDSALRNIVKRIEGTAPLSFEVSAEEREAAASMVTQELKDALDIAKSNIEKFHSAQRYSGIEVEVMSGVKCSQRSVPIRRVGLYIPGGTAPLFSTVLMLAIPASIAGCKEIVLCSPAKDGKIAPEILYAAELCGVTKVYGLGGAQAIAAMAYGTESVTKVDKIFGPGNRYVTKAKQIVSTTQVAIDMPAGPSEVLVVADESASSEFVAADLLSQAEHGADSQAILVCTSESFAREVNLALTRQLASLPRKEAAASSIASSRAIVFSNLNRAIEFTEEYAPEHLIIATENPWIVAAQITTAGSIFVGHYSNESAGDYASGTNHTLPTGGWARSYSGVSLESFTRRQTYQELTAEGVKSLAETVITMAKAEGLDAHAFAMQLRYNSIK